MRRYSRRGLQLDLDSHDDAAPHEPPTRALARPVTNSHASFYTARRTIENFLARVAELVDAADSDNTN